MIRRGKLFALAALLAAGHPSLAAEPAPAPPLPAGPAKGAKPLRTSMALVSVTRGEGLSDRTASTIEEVLLNALQESGHFSVVGRSDINAVLTLEAQQQAAGCQEDSECMAKIAGALGVDLVATAAVGRLGTMTVLSFKVINVRTVALVVRAQESMRSDDQIPAAAALIAWKTVKAVWPDAPDVKPPELPTVDLAAPAAAPAAPEANAANAPHPARVRPAWGKPLGWVAVALGVVALAAGTGLGVAANSADSKITSKPEPGAAALSAMNAANSLALGANIGLIGGGVLAAAGVGVVIAF